MSTPILGLSEKNMAKHRGTINSITTNGGGGGTLDGNERRALSNEPLDVFGNGVTQNPFVRQSNHRATLDKKINKKMTYFDMAN